MTLRTQSSSAAIGLVAICLVSSVAGCSSGGAGSDGTPDTAAPDPSEHVFGGDRPVSYFYAPSTYRADRPAPLVLVLHGYSAGGAVQEKLIFRMHEVADTHGFFVAAPDGTIDRKGSRFWNATDTCCNFDGSEVDDVAYLTGLVDEIASKYSIDRSRVYLVGHSNGGSMAYRLACDVPEKFAGVVALAAPFWSDLSRCNPKVPIAVLHLHGTADADVPYAGQTERGLVHRGAKEVADAWAKFDRCDGKDDAAGTLDLDRSRADGETTITRYRACAAPADVELWTMAGIGHLPSNLTADFPERLWQFLAAHHR